MPNTNELFYGLLGIFPVGLILFFFVYKKMTISLFFYFILFLLIFSVGSISIITGIAENLLTLIIDFLIVFRFLLLLINKRKIILPYWKIMLSFIIVCLISMLINKTNITQLFLFFRFTILPILLFLILLNDSNFQLQISKFKNLLFLLFVSQIFIGIGKAILLGQAENFIGSFAIKGGDLTTIVASIGVILSFTEYLLQKKKINFLILAGFISFALIGGKRAILFYAPVLIIILYLKYLRLNKKPVKNIITVLLFLPLLIFPIVVFNPSLNPENKIGGSFNFNFLSNYMIEYLSPGKTVYFTDELGADYFGRAEAPIGVYLLLNQRNSFLFGLGPGDIIPSKYTTNDPKLSAPEFITSSKYNIGYGARTGVLFFVMQIGLLGTIVYLTYFIKIFNCVSETRNDNSIIILGLFSLFLLDFFTYSRLTTIAYSFLITYSTYLSDQYKNNYNLNLQRKV